MPCFPIVARELRVAARRRGTYRVRFWAVLLMGIVFAWNVLGSEQMRLAAGAGQLLHNMAFFAFLYALFIGAVSTSDSVSAERRGGTLGFLFLTDLRGYDVIAGKLAASSLNALYALIAILPILGVPLLIGGVTLEQVLKLALALLSIIVFSLSIGILVSTLSRNERKAMTAAMLILAGMTVVPFVVMFMMSESWNMITFDSVWIGLMFSPGYVMALSLDSTLPPGWPPDIYWYSLALIWLFTALALASASRMIARSWQDANAPPRKSKAARACSGWASSHLPGLIERNPFLWLALRGEPKEKLAWLFALSMLGLWFVVFLQHGRLMFDPTVLGPQTWFIHNFIILWIIIEACRRFIEDRRNNALELLLSTPLEEREIVRGQALALLKQFGWPIALLLAWETMIFWLAYDPPNWLMPRMISFLFWCVAIAWAGMWLGMISKSRGQAILIGVTLAIVAPGVLHLLLTRVLKELYGAYAIQDQTHQTLVTWIMFALNASMALVVLLWARQGLSRNFRQRAAERYTRAIDL